MAYQSEIEKLEQRFGEKPEQWFAALADAYRKAGDLDMALDILNTWIEKRPNYTSGHIVRGRCLVDRQQDPEAAQAFQGVLELDPENIIAIKALSDIATRAGNEGQARHWLQRLLEVDPMNEEAHAALEALSAPVPTELPPAEAPPEEPAAVSLQGVAEGGPETSADPLAIARQLGDLGEAERATKGLPPEGLEVAPPPGVPAEEATVEMEPAAAPPAAPPELTVEAAPEVERLEAGEPAAEAAVADEGGVDASGLEIEAFDEEMGWDAGERISHAISQADIEEAQHLHENSLDVPAHALPGIEEEEVPDVGVEARDAPAVEGLDVPPAAPEEEPAPVSGFEPTVPEAAAQPVEEPPAGATPAPVTAAAPPGPEPVVPVAAEPPAAPGPAAVPEPEEGETRTTGPRSLDRAAAPQAEEELPLIMPEEEAAPEAPPEPLVTETMAQVYVAQGHLDQAREIYRKLLARQPGNAALAAKLADLDARAAPSTVAPGSLRRFAAAATGGASVTAVLAEILGVEPRPAAAPPPRPAGWKPSWPATPPAPEAAPPPAAPAPAAATPAPPAAEEAEEEDFSFDEFFGGEGPSAPPGPTTRRAAEDEGSEDDFRSWLKSLKT